MAESTKRSLGKYLGKKQTGFQTDAESLIQGGGKLKQVKELAGKEFLVGDKNTAANQMWFRQFQLVKKHQDGRTTTEEVSWVKEDQALRAESYLA